MNLLSIISISTCTCFAIVVSNPGGKFLPNTQERLESSVPLVIASSDKVPIKAFALSIAIEPAEHVLSNLTASRSLAQRWAALLSFFVLTNRYAVLMSNDPGDFITVRKTKKHAPRPLASQNRHKAKSAHRKASRVEHTPPIHTSSADPPTERSGLRFRFTAPTMVALATVMLATILVGVLLWPGLVVALVTDSFQAALRSMVAATRILSAVCTSCVRAGNRRTCLPDSAK